jgi:hypothetical protein
MQDLWMSVEDLLNLTREELLASTVDDLLASAGQLDVAVLVDVAAEVARAEPTFVVEGLSTSAQRSSPAAKARPVGRRRS